MTSTPMFSGAYAEQEHIAYMTLLSMGVALGEPVYLTEAEKRVGHMMCAFHLVMDNGDEIDGGSASTLLGYLKDGTYGAQPGEVTLHPCKELTFQSEEIVTDEKIAEVMATAGYPDRYLALAKALMAQAWNESHRHCARTGCTNPYVNDDPDMGLSVLDQILGTDTK